MGFLIAASSRCRLRSLVRRAIHRVHLKIPLITFIFHYVEARSRLAPGQSSSVPVSLRGNKTNIRLEYYVYLNMTPREEWQGGKRVEKAKTRINRHRTLLEKLCSLKTVTAAQDYTALLRL